MGSGLQMLQPEHPPQVPALDYKSLSEFIGQTLIFTQIAGFMSKPAAEEFLSSARPLMKPADILELPIKTAHIYQATKQL